MWFWFFYLIVFLIWIHWTWKLFSPLFVGNQRIQKIEKLLLVVRAAKESIESGRLIDLENLDQAAQLNTIEASLFFQSVCVIRSEGGSLGPTLNRWIYFLQVSIEHLLQGRSASQGAQMQIIACSVISPIAFVGFYFSFNFFNEWLFEFLGCLLLSEVFVFTAWIWAKALAEKAARGGLDSLEFEWPILCLSVLEHLQSLIRCGKPADLAWSKAVEYLLSRNSDLAKGWKPDLWKPAEAPTDALNSRQNLKNELFYLGVQTNSAIWASLLNGHPVVERIESLCSAFIVQWKFYIDREIRALPQNLLVPLYVLVLPGILGFVFFCLWMSGIKNSEIF